MTRWRCSLQNTGSGKGKASSSNGKEKGGGRGGRREKETEQKGHRTQVRAMARFLFFVTMNNLVAVRILS